MRNTKDHKIDEHIKYVELQIERILNSRSYDSRTLSDIKSSVFWEHEINKLIIGLERYVACENLGTKTFQWPLNWWEHFKQDWFPEWLLVRFPIKYEIKEIHGECFYPEISIPDAADKVIKLHIAGPYEKTFSNSRLPG